MARARNIKPALFKNEILGVADPMHTLLFAGLWLLADREGRLEDRPLRIKGELFPYRDGLAMEPMLKWLHDYGFIIRYEYGGNRYIEIISFTKHQNPHKNEVASEIPAASMGCISTDKIGTSTEEISSTPADSLSLDSLSLDSLTTDTGSAHAEPAPAKADAKEKLKPRNWVKELVAQGVDEQSAKDWMAVRKTKRAKMTDSALEATKREATKAGMTLAQAVKVCAESSWQGFKAEWFKGNTSATKHTGFASRNYQEGLTANEDGTYDF